MESDLELGIWNRNLELAHTATLVQWRTGGTQATHVYNQKTYTKEHTHTHVPLVHKSSLWRPTDVPPRRTDWAVKECEVAHSQAQQMGTTSTLKLEHCK